MYVLSQVNTVIDIYVYTYIMYIGIGTRGSVKNGNISGLNVRLGLRLLSTNSRREPTMTIRKRMVPQYTLFFISADKIIRVVYGCKC